MDNKKVYICTKCGSHKVINSNESIEKCNRCGSSVKEVDMPFIPQTFSSIKKFTTLEIKLSKLQDMLEKDIIVNNLKTNKLFITHGVIKCLYEENFKYYIYFTKNGNKIHIEKYDMLKTQKFFTFSLICSADVIFNFDNLMDEYEVTNYLYHPGFNDSKGYKNRKRVEVEASIDIFRVTQSIFTYLSNTREIEEITVNTDKKDFITINKNNKEIKKYHKIINVNDSIKIYTYDQTMAYKIRHHIFKCEWWEVRPFIRRKFDKRDKNLPINQRRIISIKYIDGFIKGTKRNEHQFGEQTNKKYVIKEEVKTV